MPPQPANALEKEIRALAERYRLAACGVADLTGLAQQKPDILDALEGDFSRAVVLGVRLQDAALETVVDRPTPLYFHLYRQANYHLDRAAFELAGVVQAAGHAALAIPASQIISRNPMRGHLSHKLLGWAAGIGWIGRSSLLIHPEFGSRMRYVTVLTDAPLQPGRPHEGSCGNCTQCVAACPAGAIHESFKDFDLRACYEKLSEFTRIPGIGQHICGVCVRACRSPGKSTGGGS
jgi:epoxyqueuosine reductase